MTDKTIPIEHDLPARLKNGEKVLWVGLPDPRFTVGFVQGVFLFFLAIWIGAFASNIPRILENGGSRLTLAAFSILLLFIFAATLLGPWQKRRRSQYALSTQRAFIRFHWPLLGPRLYSWPITSGTGFHVVRPEPLSVYFAKHRVFGTNPPLRFGFQRIANGEAVLKMMKDIREVGYGGYAYAAPKPEDSSL